LIGFREFLGGVLLMLLNFNELADAVPDIDCLFGDLIELLIDDKVLLLFFGKEVAFGNKLEIELLQVVLDNKELIFKCFLFQVTFLR
jgi:hypothetical protein